jgi:hypothetical protein
MTGKWKGLVSQLAKFLHAPAASGRRLLQNRRPLPLRYYCRRPSHRRIVALRSPWLPPVCTESLWRVGSRMPPDVCITLCLQDQRCSRCTPKAYPPTYGVYVCTAETRRVISSVPPIGSPSPHGSQGRPVTSAANSGGSCGYAARCMQQHASGLRFARPSFFFLLQPVQ